MKVAIHPRPGSYSDRWIKYSNEKNIDYKLVNCYDTEILSQVKDCDALMWHWDHNDYKSMLFAKQLTMIMNDMGIKTYPDFSTSWHFDDKIGQKYLLEAIGAPLVPTYIFYSEKEANSWAARTTFPKVFKLKGGAGSVNVKLVRNRNQAKRLIRKAFNRGFRHINRWASFGDKIYNFRKKRGLSTFIGIFKGIGRFFIPTQVEKLSGKQKGYVYFQDFIPDNDFDIRLEIFHKNKCYGLRRFNRNKDFRASGSGIMDYNKDHIDLKCVKLAFDIAKKINAQSVVMDLVCDKSEHKLLEISYCTLPNEPIGKIQGYWDADLVWHDELLIAEKMIFDSFLLD